MYTVEFQVAQRGGRCFISGTIPGEVVCSSEQPAVVDDVPDACRGVELDEL